MNSVLRGLLVATVLTVAAGPAMLAGQQEPRPKAASIAVARPAPAAWLGITFDNVWTRDSAWVVVREVHPRAPAERAGLLPGDTVRRLDGRAATPTAFRNLALQPGDTVRLRIRRGGGRDREYLVVADVRPNPPRTAVARWGDTLNIDPNRINRIEVLKGAAAVELYGPDAATGVIRIYTDRGERIIRIPSPDSLTQHLEGLRVRMEPEFRRLQEQLQRSRPEVERLSETARVLALELDAGQRAVAGAEFAELNADLAGYFRGAEDGLLVLRVAPQTPAARAGLRAGDVVTRVEGDKLNTVRDLRRVVATARDREVKLSVVRKGRTSQLTLRWAQ